MSRKKASPKAGQGDPPVTGRPSLYTDELAEEILVRLSSGETLASICDGEGMPTTQTVHQWRHARPAFFDAYARARQEYLRAMGDTILEIADDAISDFEIRVPLDSKYLQEIREDDAVVFRYDKRHVNRAQLMINTRQWQMERLLANEYGAKSRVDVHVFEEIATDDLLGEIAEALIAADISVDEIAAAMAALGGGGEGGLH